MRFTEWIGEYGLLFKKVSLIMVGLGYPKPAHDSLNETGTYFGDMCRQYECDLSVGQMTIIVEYARKLTVGQLTKCT